MSESTAVDSRSSDLIERLRKSAVHFLMSAGKMETSVARLGMASEAELLNGAADEIELLQRSLTAAAKPLVMADGSPFADYLRNTVPEGTRMDEWTAGYEACKQRLAAILLPQLEQK